MLWNMTVAELSALLAARKASSVEITEAFLQRITDLNPALNSFVTITAEHALRDAKAADAKRAQNQAGPLTGIPIAHKDIFCTEGVRTTCSSKMLDNFIAPYDATVVTRLKEAGCVMLGKTNMDEFAMGSSNETCFYGNVKNPWDLTRVPGGSSGGSAAAVAARLAPCATGTDTGGSIRQPAALCNLVGFKPTYGRVSRYGMIAFASSLDQAGPMTRTVEDAALLLSAMAGWDPKDSTNVNTAVPNYMSALKAPTQGLKVGLPKEFFDDTLDAGIRKLLDDAIATLRSLGCTFVPISLPRINLSVPVYYVVASAECSSNLSRYDGVRFGYRCQEPADLLDLYKRSRSEGFGAEVKRRILIGTYALSAGYYDAYYLKAQQVRALIAQDFTAAFETVDVILGPTAPGVAFPFGAKTTDPVQMYLQDIFTIGVNLAGLPALSLPCGLLEGLPVGMQLIAPAFEEARLFTLGHAYQQHTQWHAAMPSGLAALSA